MPDAQNAPPAPAAVAAPASGADFLSRAFLTGAGTSAVAAFGNLSTPALIAVTVIAVAYLVNNAVITAAKIRAGIPVKA